MWLGDPASDLVTSSGGGGVWMFLAVIVMTLGGLATTYLLGTRGRDRPAAIAPEAAAPVAVATAHDALEDFRNDFYDPIKVELEEQRRLRVAAERAQAEAERAAAACAAQREELQRQLTQALQELSQERRRDD